MSEDRQEYADRFYHKHGPCCAGCDWWRHVSSTLGECLRSAPVSQKDRLSQLDIVGYTSLDIGAGQPYTRRDHWCGEFNDTFDWQTLPLPYRKSVGAPL